MMRLSLSLLALSVGAQLFGPCQVDEPPTPTLAPTPTIVGEACVISGCSGQICAEEAMPSTCEWVCEYGCYQFADCEVQADNACGWTGNEEFDACMDDCARFGEE